MDIPVPSPLSPESGFLDTAKVVDQLGLTEGMVIGDFGSGTGYFAILMGQKVGQNGKINAIDIQEAPLESVKSKAKSAGLANIEPIRGNLEIPGGSSLLDNSQDLVILANILFQNTKKGDILREARRALKDGGRLVVIDWKKGAGGGPPDNLRTDQTVMQSLIVAERFTFDRNIDAGKFHYGMIFKK